MKPIKNKTKAEPSNSQTVSTPLSNRRGVGGEASRIFGVGGDALWLLTPLAILVVFGTRLVLQESEFLLRAQEMNLWLPTGLFWKTLMQYPGGAASWLATYLTQYFYYPWLGVSILCGLWLIICLMLTWVYRLKGPWVALTALVPLALMACFVQTGYWLFYQKLPGHLFVPTVGVFFATLTLVVQRCLDVFLSAKAARWMRFVWLLIVCLVGYPFFGAWALGATGLLVLSLPFPVQRESEVYTAENQLDNSGQRNPFHSSPVGDRAEWRLCVVRIFFAIISPLSQFSSRCTPSPVSAT